MQALKAWIQRYQLASLVLLTVLLAVVLPLALDIFRLNLVGKYLTYAFVAIGLVMVWGYGGVLSLGQGVFFGLGGVGLVAHEPGQGPRRSHPAGEGSHGQAHAPQAQLATDGQNALPPLAAIHFLHDELCNVLEVPSS